MTEKIVLDTSIVVEYVILRSRHRSKVIELFEKASRNEVILYVTPVTLSEVLYVVSRIYRVAGVPDPNREALDFIEWLSSRVKTIEIGRDVAIRAGELKKKLRIALPDCYVIAVAEKLGATPLFKKVEEEMEPVISELESLGARFLSEDSTGS